MAPAVVLVGLAQALALIIVGVPTIFIPAQNDRIACVVVLVVVMLIATLISFHFAFLAPLRVVVDSLSQTQHKASLSHLHPSVTDVDPKTAATDWAERPDNGGASDFVLQEVLQLEEEDVGVRAKSSVFDLFALQCAARDAARSVAQFERVTRRLIDLIDNTHPGAQALSPEPFLASHWHPSVTACAAPPVAARSHQPSPVSDDLLTCHSDGPFVCEDTPRTPIELSPPRPTGPCLIRGRRFQGDTPRIVLYIERSKNANLVLYEGAEAAPLKASKAIDAYWMDIDPKAVAKARAKGILTDRVELWSLERAAAYGVNVTGDGPVFDLRFTALKSRAFSLRWASVLSGPSPQEVSLQTLPVLVADIAGHECYAERLYVMSKEGYVMPTVIYVDLFGIRTDNGELVKERIEP